VRWVRGDFKGSLRTLVTVHIRKAETVDQLVCLPAFKAFALIDAAGDRAYRFLELFTAQIRNPHNFITCS
jgi:hypothetical protein